MTPETLGCEVGAWEGGDKWGTYEGDVKIEGRGMQRGGEEAEIETDWGQTWPLIEGMDQ